MAWIRIVLAAAIIALPIAADAAELAVPPIHKAHAAKVHHRHIVHIARAHFGYYWGHRGWRSGGTASSWYGSSFVLAGGPWDRPGVVLKASPKGVAFIHCTERRPDACLAEPVVVPAAVAALPIGR